MPGFIAQIGNVVHENIFQHLPVPKKDKINDHLHCRDIYVERLTINKFMDDKVFLSDDDFFILVEGVVLNSRLLTSKYSQGTFKDCIIEMYKRNGETFFNEFRGSFCGIFCDKKSDLKLLFTDHIGSKQLFFANCGGGQFILASDMLYMAEYFKYNNIPRNLDINGAYFLLTLGFMLEDSTLFREIKKLLPGHYIKFQHNTCEIKRYYKLKFSYCCKLPQDEILEKLDKLFINAVYLAFEKDKQYGYKHIVNLSAGLDSRMTTFVANELGYGDDILNNTFSQTGCLDEAIPKQIASDLRHQWLFKSLDNGIYLMDINKALKITCGMSFFSGSSHTADYYDTFNFHNYGLVHSGQLGDAVVGSILQTNNSATSQGYSVKSISNSKFFDLNSKIQLNFQLLYDNEEEFKFFTRTFFGTNQGLLASQRYTETYSPFYDIDFMEFCFSIPPEYRIGHKLYHKWINLKHPAAANYVWERIGRKINDKSPKMITVLGRTVPLVKLPSRAYRYIYKRLRGKPFAEKLHMNPFHMNPFGYWYDTNDKLHAEINSYYKNNAGVLSQFPTLAQDCDELFKNGKVSEKAQVLTLVGMLKMYFS